MWKLVLIVSLPVIVASVAIAQLLGARRLRQSGRTTLNVSAEAALRRLLAADEQSLTQLVIKGRGWNSLIKDGQIFLTEKQAKDTSAAAVGRAVWLAGLAHVEGETPQLIKWWRAARSFGQVGVPFLWLLAILAVLAVRFSTGTAIALALGGVGLACGMCLLQLPLHLQAVRYGNALLEKARFLNRMDDVERVQRCASSWGFREALPVCLGFLLSGKAGTGKE